MSTQTQREGIESRKAKWTEHRALEKNREQHAVVADASVEYVDESISLDILQQQMLAPEFASSLPIGCEPPLQQRLELELHHAICAKHVPLERTKKMPIDHNTHGSMMRENMMVFNCSLYGPSAAMSLAKEKLL